MARQESGGSSPWSCRQLRPASRAVASMTRGSSSANTPTRVAKGGRAAQRSRAVSGATRRGLPSTKLKPKASTPSSTPSRTSSRRVRPHNLTRTIMSPLPPKGPGAPRPDPPRASASRRSRTRGTPPRATARCPAASRCRSRSPAPPRRPTAARCGGNSLWTLLEHEILPEHRHLDRPLRLRKVCAGSKEEARLRQDRKRRGARPRITAGDVRHGGARLDVSPRRRGLLDLGDDVDPPLAAQGGAEIARRRGAGRQLDDAPGRELLLVPRHLRPLRPHDPIQNVHDPPAPRLSAPRFRAPRHPAGRGPASAPPRGAPPPSRSPPRPAAHLA